MNKTKVFVPPIKIQGIKTKLIPIIRQNVLLTDDTIWIEPFTGSGVVGFNIRPKKAVFADINPYIIDFYNSIKTKKITSSIVREFLEEEGSILAEKNDEYYYIVRDRFNKEKNPLDFLFLNRTCFNGMIRFNKNKMFNVPYCHKPHRFTKAYITKIINQIKYVEEQLIFNDWDFICQSFEATISNAPNNSFIYCDPPYIGRHVDYYDSWDESNENELKNYLVSSSSKFMLSTWDYNQYRKNEYIEKIWKFCNKINVQHCYHVGAKESNRNPMMEALLTNYKNNTNQESKLTDMGYEQLSINLSEIN